MASPQVESLDYNALVTTTLKKWARTKLEDQTSKSNPFFYLIKKRGLWKPQEDLGQRAAIPLMYALANVDSYAGFNPILAQEIDGITTALYDWRNIGTSVMISGDEEAQNRSRSRMINLLESKTMQTEMGMKEFTNRVLLQGNLANAAGNHIYDPYTSSRNGSVFVDPLGKIIQHDPTAARSVGGIAQNTYTWWRNYSLQSSATTYALLGAELDLLCQEASKGPGGDPDLWLCSQGYERLYKKFLRSFHHNPDFRKADLPFKNVLFNDEPMCWDELLPDWANETTTESEGTLIGVNTRFWEVQVDKFANFTMGPWQKPIGVDGRVAEFLLRAAILCGNRRKQCVMDDIDLTIAS